MFNSPFSPYSVVAFCTIVASVYCMVRTNKLLNRLEKRTAITKHWSGTIWVKHLKELVAKSAGNEILPDAKKALLMMRLSYYIIYWGLLIMALLLVIGI